MSYVVYQCSRDWFNYAKKMTNQCFFCEKKYDQTEDLIHHLELEHQGMSSDLLDEAMKSLQTKKQLGNYVGEQSKSVGFECPLCFEIFTDFEKIVEHGKIKHNKQLNPEFIEKLKKMPVCDENHPPTCEKCHQQFIGLVTTRMDGKVKNVCFTCYENHYGKNALTRLTIGTPDDILDQMRKPIRKN